MRFLCLHGTGANADVLQTQIAAVAYDLERDTKAIFHFVNGQLETSPATPTIAETYDPPYYQYYNSTTVSYKEQHLSPVRVTSASNDKWTAEDHMRKLSAVRSIDAKTVTDACDFICKIVEQEGPFDGLVGFSQGASLAATALLRDAPQLKQIKCAVFICAAAAINSDGTGPVLADESPQRIKIPTVHITGALDPYRMGSMALYNICNGDKATHFEHGKGHLLPWDKATTKVVAGMVREVMNKFSDT